MSNMSDKYSIENLLNNVESEKIDLEDEIESEVENDSNENRKLYVDKLDKSTSDLFRMILEGELNLQPDYQRKFVWDKKTMSKFIESLLLSIPIPTIFLSENNDDTFEVIDGQQRLTTIFAFMKSKHDLENMNNSQNKLKDIEELKLSGLETLRQYNGKTYSDMTDMQRKFNNVSLPVIIIKKDSSEDIKYDIFSRINSGAIKLNSQELLNVMYRGVLLKTLDEVSTTVEVDNLFGKRPVLKKRFGYHEILLRAKAMECFINTVTWTLQEVNITNTKLFDKKEIKRYNGRLNNAIIEYLKEFRDDINEATNLRKFVEDTVKKVSMVFGENAFRRIDKINSTSINKSIAELQLVVLSKFDIKLIKKNKEKIAQSFKEFISKNDENIFIRGTNNTSNVEKRYKWGVLVSEILQEN